MYIKLDNLLLTKHHINNDVASLLVGLISMMLQTLVRRLVDATLGWGWQIGPKERRNKP